MASCINKNLKKIAWIGFCLIPTVALGEISSFEVPALYKGIEWKSPVKSTSYIILEQGAKRAVIPITGQLFESKPVEANMELFKYYRHELEARGYSLKHVQIPNSKITLLNGSGGDDEGAVDVDFNKYVNGDIRSVTVDEESGHSSSSNNIYKI